MVKVYDTVSKQTLIFPMLPEKISFEAGSTFLSYDLMNIGEVKMPSGETVSTVSFDGVLPSEKKKNAPYVSDWRPPKEIQGLFSSWKVERRKLRLTVDGTPINHGVYLENYKVDYTGGMGDYEYSISFIVAREIVAETTENKTMTYVTVQGDTWWSVAQQTTGSGSNYASVKKNAKKTATQEVTQAAVSSGSIAAGTSLPVPARTQLRSATSAIVSTLASGSTRGRSSGLANSRAVTEN